MKKREHIKWRRGRSIPFRWSIKIGGQVPELEEGEIKLFMRNGVGAKVAWPYEIEDGNVLVFEWLGADQKRGGVYTFTALYHDGLEDQNVLDSCVDIELVESTCDENDCCGCGDFSVEPVYMEGDFFVTGGTSKGAVRYDKQQDLTDEQKQQAKNNIGVEDEIFVAEYGVTTFAEVKEAYEAGKSIKAVYVQDQLVIEGMLTVASESLFIFSGYANFGIGHALVSVALSEVSGWTFNTFVPATQDDLEGKVDKVTGKGLSTNDYTDADKDIVEGVTTALAGKQDTLIAGTNITIAADGKTISATGGSAEGAVRYDEAQTLTPSQQEQARENIDVPTFDDGAETQGGVIPNVRYDEQTLTEAQKSQALSNLGVDLDRMISEAHIGGTMYVGKLTDGHYFAKTTKPAVANIAELYGVPSSLTSYQDMMSNSNVSRITAVAWDTSSVIRTRSAFSGCSLLKSIDISEWDTSNVTDMQWMFTNCPLLAEINVSGIDVGKVNSMYQMFYKCSSLTYLDVSGWDTSSVTTMYGLFGECESLSHLDVSGWDTSSVTSMQNLFYKCNSLTELDVSGWDTGNVTDMKTTFRDCSGLSTLDTKGWNTSNVTNMGYMFASCSSLTSLDLSGWNTSNVTDMNAILHNCSSLTTLIGTHTLQEVLDGLGALNGTSVALSLSPCTLLDRASLRAVINGLADLTDQTSQTLTLGNTLKAKLTADDIQIATDKNWTIA